MTLHGAPAQDGFETMTPRERLDAAIRFAGLDAEDHALLAAPGLDPDIAERMIEQQATTLSIPVGIATDMIVDGAGKMVPMATEETSIVGFVTDAARRCRAAGGFFTSSSGAVMIAQVVIHDLPDPERARHAALAREAEIGALCNACDETLVRFGGGFRGLEARVVDTASGPMPALHLLIDMRDAMGANAVNTMAEAVAPHVERWTGGRAALRILSNFADRRLARARASWRPEDIGGAAARDAMLRAAHFAAADPWRAATDNKGIMNGISAVVLATGADTRAVEAGAHAWAARTGRCDSLTRWEIDAEGNLCGAIELPMAVGTVGGATRAHPTAAALLRMTGETTADGLGPPDRRRGPCAEPRRPAGAVHRGHPEGPHGPARRQRGARGGRARRRRGPRRPRDDRGGERRRRRRPPHPRRPCGRRLTERQEGTP
ncbi:hydroxymethylglutaryl-CoA reductase, degradative [Rhodovulum sp. DZ06]|uniref:hydroxymethylglutaryl-CoA reductase, degradative n=1 Tax=Rhodovulum sp. DZ06 TaxID=3425126 RepID=UPI003D32C40F